MHHAIELLFDPDTEAAIRGHWQRLQDAGIPCALADLGASPHVSLGVYDRPLPERWLEPARAWFEARAPVSLTFSSVGTFPGGEGVVFLAPVVTDALLDLHTAYHAAFDEWRSDVRPYYLPGAWVPHCTMGIFLPPEQVTAAMALLQDDTLPIVGAGTRIELLAFEGGMASPVEILAEIPLSART